jgi:hypothetical protein
MAQNAAKQIEGDHNLISRRRGVVVNDHRRLFCSARRADFS